MAHQVVRLLLCHRVRLSYTQSRCLAFCLRWTLQRFTASPAKLSGQVLRKLCSQLFAQGTSTILSCPLLPHVVCLEIFGECCPVEIQSLLDPSNPSLSFPSILAMGQDNLHPAYQMSPLPGTAWCYTL